MLVTQPCPSVSCGGPQARISGEGAGRTFWTLVNIWICRALTDLTHFFQRIFCLVELRSYSTFSHRQSFSLCVIRSAFLSGLPLIPQSHLQTRSYFDATTAAAIYPGFELTRPTAGSGTSYFHFGCQTCLVPPQANRNAFHGMFHIALSGVSSSPSLTAQKTVSACRVRLSKADF